MHYLNYCKNEERKIQSDQQKNESLPKYYLSICTIVKDEGPYLQEWIEFHRLVGVEHFYIYDNNSTDNSKDILKEYIVQGIVTLIPWPTKTDVQVGAYEDWIKKFKQKTTWIAIIDVDEFLFSTYEQNLKKVLNEYENYAGVSINCLMFSNSNHFYTPSGSVIENYTIRPEDNSCLHNCIKSIHNTKYITSSSTLTPHFFTYKDDLKAVDENFCEIVFDEKPPFGAHSKNVSFKKLRINHYKFKSIQNSVKKSSVVRIWHPEYKNYIERLKEVNSKKQIQDLLLKNKFNEYVQNSKKKDILIEKFRSTNKLDPNLQKKIFMNDLNRFYPMFPNQAVTLLWQSRNIKINLDSPTNLNDKILWLGVNLKHKLIYDCTDKYDSREIVSQTGYSKLLPKLFGIYNTYEELKNSFAQLPDKFVIKGTVGCGQTILCENKKEFDLDKHASRINQWLATDYSRFNLEKYYIHRPRIICEEYIVQDQNYKYPFDYKIFCFNGKARFIMLCTGRSTQKETHYYFDTNWNRLNILKKEDFENNPKKPDRLKELIHYAERLAAPFVQVRVDFYVTNNRIIFGEFTFTTAAGYIPDIKPEFIERMGNGLILPEHPKKWNTLSPQNLIQENKKLLDRIESDPKAKTNAFNLPILRRKYLSICAIVKDEGPYLKEWIEFHKLVGVEHFYIYDNNSTDNTKQILQPYITQGLVTNIYWQMHPGQTQAYNHCLKNYGKDSKWIAFIDLDEFLFGTKKDNLKDILNEYENYSGIGINWVCFGSNNIEKKTNELVIKRFTKRAFLNFLPNKHIKSIVQPSLTECAGNTPHQFIYKNNSLAVDENFKFIQKNESLLKNISINKIRINHYLVKSKEECLEKINRGRATIKDNRKEDYFEKHNKNDEEDITILRFLPNLKKALEFNPVIFLSKKSHILKKSVEIFKNKLFLIKKSINLNKTPFYFDWNFYVNNYYDLQLAKIDTKEKAVDHWIKYGKKEGRICSPIFAKKKAPKKENEIRGELEILNKLNLSKIRQKNPLSAELLKNANIIYCITDKQEKEKYLGVVDSSNNLNSIDLYLRLKLANLFFSPKKCTKMDYLDGEYIFAGYLVNHYGHFLVESINRAWYLKKFPNKKIIWITGSKEAKFNLWQEEILDILNIKNKYVLVSQPTKIETLIVPDAGFIYKNHFNCEHAKSIGLFDSKEIQKGKKVWLSRSGDVLKNKFTIKNEPELEKVLEKKGWIIFHPEQHSVKTQIKMICYAERIAGFMGSAFHSIIFLNNPSAKITIFNRNSQKIDSNYILIKTTKNLNQEERYLKLKQINNRLFEVNSIEEILKIIEN